MGAYLGLCPKRRDSGERRPELRITKAGDTYLRQLLVQCAHYILGPFPDTDLRRFGERLIAQGGTRAKKRARVAVARKLAVLLHAGAAARTTSRIVTLLPSLHKQTNGTHHLLTRGETIPAQTEHGSIQRPVR